jgi:hypothetical protein
MADNLPPSEPPIEYPIPVDLVALVHNYMPPDGDRGSFSISGCPKHVTWEVESLAGRAGVSQARTYACLLERGMRAIWKFPGARDLQRAREAIVARDDPDTMRWIDTWEFDLPTEDTGNTIAKMRVSVEGVMTPLGKLARVLGFNKSKTAVLALTVVLLEDLEVPIRYHQAHAKLLRDFAPKLGIRAEKATEYAAKAPSSSRPPVPRSSLADIIGVRV